MTTETRDGYRLVDLSTGRNYRPVATLQAALDRKTIDRIRFWEIWNKGKVVRNYRDFTF